VQVVDDHGTVLVASRRIEGRPPIFGFTPGTDRVGVRTVHGLHVPGSEHTTYRVAAIAARGPTGPATVYAGSDLESVDDSVDSLTDLLVIGLPLLLVLVAGTCWFVVKGALRPVERMRRELDAIDGGSLDRRMPSPAYDDEIGGLAQTLNETLERLESSNERQQRFVADASHELQSPLASTIAELEVALADPDDCDWPATAADVLDQHRRMTRLVADLLYLARLDDGATQSPPRTLLDLDEVVREEAARLRIRSRVPIDTSQVAPVEVRGGSEQLARVVRNLLENADRHARSQVDVSLTTVARNGRPLARLRIVDDGPGVDVEERTRIFERFARADASRSRATGGAGLGLAIARQIVERHGGTLELDPSMPTTCFVIELPVETTDVRA